MIFKPFPFDPLRGLDLPRGGLSDPQSGYLKTPLIRTLPISQRREGKEAAKENEIVNKKAAETE
jgi:hypothetical protein